MLKSVFLGGCLLVASVGAASAACPGTPLTGLATLFGDKLICGTSTGSGDHYQEEHRVTGSVLWERAKGPTDPVDHSEQVGTWSVDTTTGAVEMVCYNYGPGGTYCHSVSLNSGTAGANNSTYSFCNGAAEAVTGTLITPIPAPGVNACGF